MVSGFYIGWMDWLVVVVKEEREGGGKGGIFADKCSRLYQP